MPEIDPMRASLRTPKTIPRKRRGGSATGQLQTWRIGDSPPRAQKDEQASPLSLTWTETAPKPETVYESGSTPQRFLRVAQPDPTDSAGKLQGDGTACLGRRAASGDYAGAPSQPVYCATSIATAKIIRVPMVIATASRIPTPYSA